MSVPGTERLLVIALLPHIYDCTRETIKLEDVTKGRKYFVHYTEHESINFSSDNVSKRLVERQIYFSKAFELYIKVTTHTHTYTQC
jgi:hypothetical protein